MTVGPGSSPGQPLTGCERVADFCTVAQSPPARIFTDPRARELKTRHRQSCHSRSATGSEVTHWTGRVRAEGRRSTCRPVGDALGAGTQLGDHGRSEERRVGKECVSTCRSRWSPSHIKKKNNKHSHSTNK